MTLAEKIKHKAVELGFDLAGITDASAIGPEHCQMLENWLKAGYCAGMGYMQRNLDKRTNPAALLSNARSVIVVGLNYKPRRTESGPSSPETSVGRVANYARYEDYHVFVKKLLRLLAEFITTESGQDPKFKFCVDSVPLAERSLAARAGLGFIGKNHMLINPIFGPEILLGEIITDLELPTDKPIACNCKDCVKCIAACPTGALSSDGTFDSNKCISYLTIEHKEKIFPELAQKIADRVFGCDQCVLACPFQQQAPVCGNNQFKFYPDRAKLDLKRILDFYEKDFDSEFADSVMRRTGLEKLKANARVCLDNIEKND